MLRGHGISNIMGGEALRTDEDAASGLKRIADATKNLHTFFVRPVMADSVIVGSTLKNNSPHRHVHDELQLYRDESVRWVSTTGW